MTWLLMIFFKVGVIETARFETEALCQSAAAAVMQMYADQHIGNATRPWQCVNLR